jgi:hypothetical protein
VPVWLKTATPKIQAGQACKFFWRKSYDPTRRCLV